MSKNSKLPRSNSKKIVKPFLLDKVTSTQKITLTENDKIVKNDNDTQQGF